jgi:hypothetical protein
MPGILDRVKGVPNCDIYIIFPDNLRFKKMGIIMSSTGKELNSWKL